jgi:hypothetical protein
MVTYFVSYVATQKGEDGHSIRCCESRFSRQIESIKDIDELAESLKKDFDLEKVVVTNFIKLREEWK